MEVQDFLARVCRARLAVQFETQGWAAEATLKPYPVNPTFGDAGRKGSDLRQKLGQTARVKTCRSLRPSAGEVGRKA